MRNLRSVLGLVVLGLALLLVPGWQLRAEEDGRDLSGTWTLQGWNMGTDPHGKADYDGQVTMEAKGKDTYTVSWKIGGRVVNHGVGIYDKRTDTFAAGYAIQNQPGVAVWQFSDDGKTMDCVGTFEGKIGDVAHERWSRE